MRKIKKYEIASNSSAAYLQEHITQKIKLGWEPFGSLAYVFDPVERCLVYAQALVLYDE